MGLYSACSRREYAEPSMVPAGTGTPVSFPLNLPIVGGYGGQVSFSKLADGTVRADLEITGAKPGKRYEGKITLGAVGEQGTRKVIADLRTTALGSATSASWLRADYIGRPIYFDSLLTTSASITITELDLDSARGVPVLQGDLFMSVLTPTIKVVNIVSVNDSLNITGTATLQSRKNGQCIVRVLLANSSNSKQYPISFYRGAFGQSAKVQELAVVIGGAQEAIFNFNLRSVGLSTNLADLDTVSGFIGVAPSPGLADEVVAVGNFGGNAGTGVIMEYGIYKSENDSTIVATLKFTEARNGSVVLAYLPIGVPTETGYLVLSRGTAFDNGIESIYTSAAFNLAQGQSLQGIKLYGKALSIATLDTIAAHFVLTRDTADVNGNIARGDAGKYALSGTVKTVTMAAIEALVPGGKGTLLLKERKDGSLVGFLKLNTSAFELHQITLRTGGPAGAETNRGNVIALLGEVQGSTTPYSAIFQIGNSVTGAPITLTSFAPINQHVEMNLSSGDDFPIFIGTIQ